MQSSGEISTPLLNAKFISKRISMLSKDSPEVDIFGLLRELSTEDLCVGFEAIARKTGTSYYGYQAEPGW